MSTGAPPSSLQNGTGAVAHWLAMQVRTRHGSLGIGQSPMRSQQPAIAALPKTHWLLVQAVAVWQAFIATQSSGELQHGEPPAAEKPQLVPLQLAVWQPLPVGQLVHIVPQLITLVFDLQVPLQSWKPTSQV
jgi:hypothetical protein